MVRPAERLPVVRLVSETIRDAVRVDARPSTRGADRIELFERCAEGAHARCPGPRVFAQRDRGTHVEAGWDLCPCSCHGPPPLPLGRRIALEAYWRGERT